MVAFASQSGEVTSGAAASSISSSVADSAGQLPHSRRAAARCPAGGAPASCCQLAAVSTGACLLMARGFVQLLTASVTPAVSSAAQPATTARPVAACTQGVDEPAVSHTEEQCVACTRRGIAPQAFSVDSSCAFNIRATVVC